MIICDRGAMDPSAYIDKKSWNQILKEVNLDQFSLREDRYDQVSFRKFILSVSAVIILKI